jgi:hypothetical protein
MLCVPYEPTFRVCSFDVLERAGVEVVDADDMVTLGQEVVAQVRAEKARTAGHDGSVQYPTNGR